MLIKGRASHQTVEIDGWIEWDSSEAVIICFSSSAVRSASGKWSQILPCFKQDEKSTPRRIYIWSSGSSLRNQSIFADTFIHPTIVSNELAVEWGKFISLVEEFISIKINCQSRFSYNALIARRRSGAFEQFFFLLISFSFSSLFLKDDMQSQFIDRICVYIQLRFPNED